MNKREDIYQVISKADHPLLVKELLRLLNLHREDSQTLKPLLRRMVREGQIVRLRGRRYGLPQKMDLVPGRFKGHREGYGFVIPDPDSSASSGAGDVYIGARKNHGAMNGDRVVARIERHKSGERCEGRVIRILERAHTELVGRFESGRNVGFVIPSDRRIAQGLCIPPEKNQGAKNGDIVIAEILVYPTKEHPAEGKILRIVGRPEDTEIDTDIVIASYGLNRDFSAEVIASASQISDEIPSKQCEDRVDLKNLPTVTIDGEQARDFDDAISIEAQEAGYRLWVHIADVANYVEAGGLLDQEAASRGTSVYFPDRVLPMFPEKLSNGICSLKPRENRLALTLEMNFGLKGRLFSHRVYESIIRSDERMTYTAVRQILEDKDSATRKQYLKLLPQFEAMAALATQLRRRRLKRGSLDFDLPEPQIILSRTGEVIDITREERNVAHRLIEEFMLVANETVAGEMTRKGIPLLYRIHEPPPEDRVVSLREMIHQFGLNPGLGKKITPKNLSEILETVKGRPEEKLINQLLLRSMQKARYSSENRGHFGLASEEYTHFTSPIRRYPDLMVHRILKQTLRSPLSDQEKALWAGKLPEIARHCSERERIAVDAERDVIGRKQLKFMADKLGIRYKGLITGLAAYGFFVQLEHYFVEGLVHVSSLDDDYYIFDEKQHTLRGRSRQRTYRLGQSVRIIVDRVDLENQKIDFKVLKR